jgi:glycosyltransferase involved in cell wall biosynthesis
VPAGVATRAYPRLGLPARDRLATQVTVPATIAGSRHDVFHFPAHGDAPALGGRGLVVTVHDLILEVMARDYDPRHALPFRIARALERSAVRRACAIVSDSAVTRDDLVSRYRVPGERVHVAHLGLHPRFTRPADSEITATLDRLELRRPYVLYLGGIDARKDMPALLEAWAQARSAAAEPMTLVIAGRVREARGFPALLDRARQLGVEPTLSFPGHVADEDLPALHAGARVFAFPSRYEGFGFPPLEAMACGAPVLSSGGGSLREVLGDAALVTPPGDTAAFAAGLTRLLADETLRRDLAARGPAHAARFTWERTAEATVAAYRAAARAGGPP